MNLSDVAPKARAFMARVGEWLRGPGTPYVPRGTAWPGSRLTPQQAWDTMALVCEHAGGKPLAEETFRGIPLPEGVTVSEAMECVRQFNAERLRARSRASVAKIERAKEEMAMHTVRTRLKIAGKKLFGKDNPHLQRKKRLAKKSRKRNR